jgi:TolB-like protein
LVDERLLTSDRASEASVMARLGGRPLPIPARLLAAIRGRSAALGDHATQALEAASVLGVASTANDVERVAGLSSTARADAIEELEIGGWLQRVGADRWDVAPPMLQRALHSMIPPLRREALHAAAAALETRHPWRLDAAARSRLKLHRQYAGRTPASSHAWQWVLASAVVLLAIASSALLLRRDASPVVRAEQTVVILPFAVSGGSEVEFLRTGMVDLLSTSLDGAAGLHTIDPRVVIAATNATRTTAPLTPLQGLQIARRLGASHFVHGTVVSAGGRLNASAILYEVRRGNTPTARASAAGSEGNLFDVVDRLSAQLAVTQGSAPDQRITQLAAVTTTSLEALKAYLAGRNAYRANDLFLALSSYQHAVAADSTFALAWYGLASTASWMMRADIEHVAAAQAERQSSRLSLRDRTLISAFAAYSRGSADSAERLARYVTETYDDIEGWVLLGEVLYHHNWKRGRSIVESRQAWRRVLALDSTYWPALQHLAEVAAGSGQVQEADSLRARYQRSVGTQHMMLASRAMRAYALGDTGIRAAIEPELASDRGFWLPLSVWYVSVLGRDIEDGRMLARHLVEPTRPPEQQGFGRVLLAHLALAQGRWKEARRELALARKLTPVDATEYEMLLDLAPFLPTTPDELAVTRAALIAQPDSPANNSMAMSWPHTQGALRPMVRIYLEGLISAREGDEAGSAHSLEALSALHDPTSSVMMAEGFAQSIRAEHERMLHHPAAALGYIERGRRKTPFAPAWTSGFVSQAYERYLHAELLHELGRDDEALRWYGTFAENSPYDLVYLAPSLYRQAQIYDARGNKALAAQRYESFLALWKECDPELAPLTANARTRLASLR